MLLCELLGKLLADPRDRGQKEFPHSEYSLEWLEKVQEEAFITILGQKSEKHMEATVHLSTRVKITAKGESYYREQCAD